jgi:putative effector of murein hydrolase
MIYRHRVAHSFREQQARGAAVGEGKHATGCTRSAGQPT